MNNVLFRMGLTLALAGFASGCGGGDDSDANTLTAPTDLEVTEVDDGAHLTWTDGEGEEHYMIERMDHSISDATWEVLPDAEELVPNTNQYHDATVVEGTTYMYRVVAMQGETRAASNIVTREF